jgi:hypothetical protein
VDLPTIPRALSLEQQRERGGRRIEREREQRCIELEHEQRVAVGTQQNGNAFTAYRATAAGDVSPIDDPGKGATATAAKEIYFLHKPES